jgi:predicted dehydrogenase
MAKQPLRIALIGAGTMGQWYAQCLGEHDAAELVAVCDLETEKAQALADTWGTGRAHADYREMLASEELDAVAVATPDRVHREPVVACLEAGKHVLCEKPLATTLEDGLAIKEAVGRSGRELMVNFGNRQRARVKMLRTLLVEDEAIGEIGNVYIELNERIGKTDELAWAADTSPLWFLLSHCVDTVRFVTGLEIAEVFGYDTRKVMPSRGLDTADTSVFVARLSNGGHAFLGSSWVYPEDYGADIDFRFRAVGSKGVVECQMHPHDLLVHTDRTRAVNYMYPYTDHRGHRRNWWFESTRRFVHCILTGQHPTPDVDDGLACLRVLLAMEEAAAVGEAVGVVEP